MIKIVVTEQPLYMSTPCTLSKLHYINVGRNGTFADSGKVQTLPEDIDPIFESITTNSKTHLVVHFHGGLVSERTGLCVAENLTPVYERALAHPITFVWETGALETLLQNLTDIHQTELFKKLLVYLAKKWIEKQIGVAGMRGAGSAWTDEAIRHELEKAKPFADLQFSEEIGARAIDVLDEAQLEAEFSIELQSDPGFFDTLDQENIRRLSQDKPAILTEGDQAGEARGLLSWISVAKALAKIAWRVFKRYRAGTDHEFYCTLMEEVLRELYLADLGEWGWTKMKEKAAEMWESNNGLSGTDQHAGRYFLDKLCAYVQHHPDFKISFVGHSAGSIAICHLTELIYTNPAYEPLRPHLHRLVFLAPACRTDLFYETIATKPNRFKSFRMFTMKDEFELKDWVIPVIYPGSLLYLVSGAFEDEADTPLVGMNRYYSGNFPYNITMLTTVANWLSETGKKRLVLSQTEADASFGLKCQAIDHSDFDNEKEVLESLVYHLAESV